MGRFSLCSLAFCLSVSVDVVNVEPIRVRANEVRHFGLADEVDWRLHPGDLPRSIVRGRGFRANVSALRHSHGGLRACDRHFVRLPAIGC